MCANSVPNLADQQRQRVRRTENLRLSDAHEELVLVPATTAWSLSRREQPPAEQRVPNQRNKATETCQQARHRAALSKTPD